MFTTGHRVGHGGLAFPTRRSSGSGASCFYLIIHRAGDPFHPDLFGRRLCCSSQTGLTVHWGDLSVFGAQLTAGRCRRLPDHVSAVCQNRFDKKAYEKPGRDWRASPWQTLPPLFVLPIIAPALIGRRLFGFTLSYDEFARTLADAGSYNTLPARRFYG